MRYGYLPHNLTSTSIGEGRDLLQGSHLIPSKMMLFIDELSTIKEDLGDSLLSKVTSYEEIAHHPKKMLSIN